MSPALCMCVTFQNPSYMLELSRVSYGYLIPQLFHLTFLVCLLPTVIYCLRQVWCSTIAYGRFDKHPWRKGCLHWASSEVGQIQSALQVRSSRGPPDRSNNDSFLETVLYSNSSLVLSPAVAARLLVFTVTAGCQFSRLPWSWGGRKQDKLKCHRVHCSYWYQPFFWNKFSPDSCKPLTNLLNYKIAEF